MEDLKISDDKIKESFPEIWKYLEDERVTDLDYNCGNLWLSTVDLLPQRIEDANVDKEYMEKFAFYIARTAGCNFNQKENTVYAGSGTMRITAIHESQSRSGLCVCIRKFSEKPRLTADNAVERGFCDERTLYMLQNIVDARMSVFAGGLPGNGKTETIKLLSSFIPKYEKVVTIEDVAEINYPIINPGANCSELMVIDGNYKECLEKILRMNARWALFGEVRGTDAQYLLECMSNGIPFMTTGHLPDAKSVPDRMLNMLNDRRDSERIVNQLHHDIGASLYIQKEVDPSGAVRRYLDQVCFYDRKGTENVQALVLDKGKLHPENIPSYLRERIEEQIGRDMFTRSERG